MTHFQLSLIATILASGLLLAQLATSFATIRFGCIFLLFGYFITIAIDAAVDKAKAEANDYYGSWLTIVTPHIGYAIGLLFLVFTGVYIGW